MEIWKDIKGYEGKYQVSNLGNVRSLNWQNTGMTRNLYLKPHNRGYLQVELVDNKVQKKMFLVHRLVAQAFIPNPHGFPQIDHVDENKINNNADNLEWCDQKENTRRWCNNHPDAVHAPRSSRAKRPRGIPYRHQGAIFQLTLDGTIVREWENAVSVKWEKGWSDWSIAECCRGNRKTAYGYKWQFATEA